MARTRDRLCDAILEGSTLAGACRRVAYLVNAPIWQVAGSVAPT
jgi:hypothetical protein